MASSAWTLYGLYDSRCPGLRLSPFESKLGGHPDFFSDSLLTSAPSCRLCHSPLVLVAQIYCPFEDSPYHRLLHIYACTQKECWSSSKSWLVLRSQSLDPSYASQGTSKERESPELEQQEDCAVTSDWCSGADDWLSEDIPSCYRDESIRDKSVQDLSLSQSKQTTPVNKETKQDALTGHDVSDVQCEMEGKHPYTGPAYPAAYIRVTSSSSSFRNSKRVSDLLQKYSVENPDCPAIARLTNDKRQRNTQAREEKSKRKHDGGSAASCAEGYEKGVAKHGDAAFLKFQKELAQCPQQVLRYNWKGEAIHMNREEPAEDVEACPACGAERTYECQLMPQTVYFLQKALNSTSSKTQDGHQPWTKCVVEFGTALVYTCSESCWESSASQTETQTSADMFRQEFIVVQIEDD